MTCLPGRVAVLVGPEAASDTVLLPAAIRERLREMEKPPHRLLRGVVVAVGRPRGADPMPRPGDAVWVLPKPGLIVDSGDLDLPALGRQVPPGHTLRFYGVGDPWEDQILGLVTEEPA